MSAVRSGRPLFRCKTCENEIPEHGSLYMQFDEVYCSSTCRRRRCQREESPFSREAHLGLEPLRPLRRSLTPPRMLRRESSSGTSIAADLASGSVSQTEIVSSRQARLFRTVAWHPLLWFVVHLGAWHRKRTSRSRLLRRLCFAIARVLLHFVLAHAISQGAGANGFYLLDHARLRAYCAALIGRRAARKHETDACTPSEGGSMLLEALSFGDLIKGGLSAAETACPSETACPCSDIETESAAEVSAEVPPLLAAPAKEAEWA